MSKLIDYLNYRRKLFFINIRGLIKLYATNQTPVLIFQMGKVGSKSVMKSLEKKAIFPLYHLHFLLKIDDNRKFYNPKVLDILEVKWRREKQVRYGEFLYNKIIVPKKQIKIISLTREPIGRNISVFLKTLN